MATALRKADDPTSAVQAPVDDGVEDTSARDRGAPVKGAPVKGLPDKGAPDKGGDVMTDPLHPMHQHLLARMSPSVAAGPVMTRPSSMAAAFYAGIAAWGAVWLAFDSASAWL